MLEEEGFSVEVVRTGEEVLQRYQKALKKKRPFDLVFLDLTIANEMGGAETQEKLLQIDSDVKSIVTSVYSQSPVMSHYTRYGFKGLIPKPFSRKKCPGGKKSAGW